ncbi:FAD-binding oxidoreductase [Actinoplanes hulinensis]|uniref:FAD-binding oxidoreductase n=1 Tax=Actinoplanes hulinensis TaxID=1144547 RepID=A0ABS7AUM4_9ACTN|nr:FAD-dependent oxidoreductase [Actinoplanes hulinensis]MBW6432468.1 FAD-binding oxidoreductase [Actinoplanes hulinensis]
MTIVDCAVVGDGIVGRFTALALAARGLRVVLSGGAPEDAGSSASALSGGLVRAYSADPFLTRLAARSLTSVWLNCPAYRRTGSVHVVPRAGLDRTALSEMAAAGVPYRVIGGPSRHPVRLERGDCAVVEPYGGFVHAGEALRWLADRCRDDAGITLTGPVRQVITRGDGFSLAGAGPAVRARQVIVAAGPGTAALLPPGSAPEVERRRIVYSFVRLGDPGAVPHTFVDTVPDTWMRPAPEQGPGVLLVGRADPMPWSRPGRRDVADRRTGLRAAEALARRIPALSRVEYLSSVVASDMYAAPGHHGDVPAPTATDGLWYVTGLSGGGFKIAPALGERIADRMTASDNDVAQTLYSNDVEGGDHV